MLPLENYQCCHSCTEHKNRTEKSATQGKVNSKVNFIVAKYKKQNLVFKSKECYFNALKSLQTCQTNVVMRPRMWRLGACHSGHIQNSPEMKWGQNCIPVLLQATDPGKLKAILKTLIYFFTFLLTQLRRNKAKELRLPCFFCPLSLPLSGRYIF